MCANGSFACSSIKKKIQFDLLHFVHILLDLFFCRYLLEQSTSLLYSGVSTYSFFSAIVYMKDTHSPRLGEFC